MLPRFVDLAAGPADGPSPGKAAATAAWGLAANPPRTRLAPSASRRTQGPVGRRNGTAAQGSAGRRSGGGSAREGPGRAPNGAVTATAAGGVDLPRMRAKPAAVAST